jgi:hypothetical protein
VPPSCIVKITFFLDITSCVLVNVIKFVKDAVLSVRSLKCGDRKFLRSVGNYLPYYMSPHPRRM